MKSSNIEIRRDALEKELEFECLKCDFRIAYRKSFGEISRKKEKRIFGVVKILFSLDKNLCNLKVDFIYYVYILQYGLHKMKFQIIMGI